MKPKERDTLLDVLKNRFGANMHRHPGVRWPAVLTRLEENGAALESLRQMESTGGEPDVVGAADKSGRITFIDCAAESPKGRRSTCYDRAARTARKEHAPKTSALEMADLMGISLLSEAEYRSLQEFEEVDLRTSSWIDTPADVRALGGALFCDRRYGRVFVYHNGVQSYYAARGFRGALRV